MIDAVKQRRKKIRTMAIAQKGANARFAATIDARKPWNFIISRCKKKNLGYPIKAIPEVGLKFGVKSKSAFFFARIAIEKCILG